MITKPVAARHARTPPDIAYWDSYDFQVAGKWAYDGKLEDISSVIEPMRTRFAPNTVETTFLYNDKAKKKAYYAFSHPLLGRHAANRRLQGKRHPEDLEGILVVLVRQGAGRSPQKDRQARLRHRHAHGRRFDGLDVFA